MSRCTANPSVKMDLGEMATKGRPKEWRALYGGHELILAKTVKDIGAKRILEFGPGESTEAFLKMEGVEHITSCEHHPQYVKEAAEQFKSDKRVRVLAYADTFPVSVDGLDGNEQFDLGFVDSPQGYNPIRKIHPGFEDCSRLNTLIFALARCKVVLLHDANRPLERGSLTRLWKTGQWDWDWLSCGEPNAKGLIARVRKREIKNGPDTPRIEEPGGPSAGPVAGKRGLPKRVGRSRQSSGRASGAGRNRPADRSNGKH